MRWLRISINLLLFVPDDIRVRVTGTVFNFKSYPEERFAKVTLVRGSLDVSSVTGRVPHTVTLKPCEQVVLDRNRDVMEKKVVETAPDVAWTCVGQRDEGISEDTAETEMTEHVGGAEALFFDEMSMGTDCAGVGTGVSCEYRSEETWHIAGKILWRFPEPERHFCHIGRDVERRTGFLSDQRRHGLYRRIIIYNNHSK